VTRRRDARSHIRLVSPLSKHEIWTRLCDELAYAIAANEAAAQAVAEIREEVEVARLEAAHEQSAADEGQEF
jgi:hypothetical protein